MQVRPCRVFEFRRAPRMSELQVASHADCVLDPVAFLAHFQ